MAIHYRTEGIVLREIDHGEAHRIVRVFTKDFGKLDLWAVSERKIVSKLRAGLGLFSLSSVEFIQGRNKKTVTDASPVFAHRACREDLKKFQVAYRIAETTHSITAQGHVNKELWQLLRDALALVNDARPESLETDYIYHEFAWNLLALEGYRPQLKQCIICQEQRTNRPVYFSFAQGGIFCKRCMQRNDSMEEVPRTNTVLLSSVLRSSIESFLQGSSMARQAQGLEPQDYAALTRVARLYISYLLTSSYEKTHI